eukprot:7267258-Prymnesium_polylepis.1
MRRPRELQPPRAGKRWDGGVGPRHRRHVNVAALLGCAARGEEQRQRQNRQAAEAVPSSGPQPHQGAEDAVARAGLVAVQHVDAEAFRHQRQAVDTMLPVVSWAGKGLNGLSERAPRRWGVRCSQ